MVVFFCFHCESGAEDGSRTRYLQLGRLSLCQMSYFRSGIVGGGGFEPPKASPTDLQSAPFDRSGTLPFEPIDGLEPPTG